MGYCGGCGQAWKQAKPIMPAMARNMSLYMLGSYSDCTTPYKGPNEGGAVIVVAPATPNERLFKWGDYEAAQAYAESIDVLQLDTVATASLCQQAVVDLYGS